MHKAIPIGLAAFGVIALIAVSVLGWVVLPKVIDNQIKKEVRLVEGSETYDKWANIDTPITMNFYIMHVTNIDEVNNFGDYPIFEEKGPYAYSEKRVKNDLYTNEMKGTISYRQTTTYTFNSTLSCNSCRDTDRVNVINVPFLSVVHAIYGLVPAMAAVVARDLHKAGETVVKNVVVGELFGIDDIGSDTKGMDVKIYRDVLSPLQFELPGGIKIPLPLGSLLPADFDNDKFGLFRLNNGKDDGLYEVHNGVKNSALFGQIAAFNNKTTLGVWKPGSHCDMVNGSDGSLFPPFVKKDSIFYLFSSDICRSLWFEYQKEVKYMGVKGYRFVLQETVMESPASNVNNECFCMRDDKEDCDIRGAMDLSPDNCRDGAPITMSAPYFLDGSDWVAGFAGIKPSRELHETTLDIEINSGVLLEAHKRLQINLELHPYKGIESFEKQKRMLFPLLWLDEHAQMDEGTIDEIKSKLIRPVTIINAAKWSVMSISLILIFVGTALFFFSRKSTATV